jgi:hypothetical protein
MTSPLSSKQESPPFQIPKSSKERRSHPTPPIDEVLGSSGKYPEPWTLTTFLDYLESEHSGENLRYWSECEALKYMKKIPGAIDPPPELLLLKKEQIQQGKEGQWLDELLKTYVVEDATNQINISAAQREALLQRAKPLIPRNEADPTILNEAQQEVKMMMLQDSWPRFVMSAKTQNITTKSKNRKTIIGGVLLSLSTILLCLFWGLFVPRYYFFLLCIPWFITIYELATAYYKQDFISAFFAKRELDLRGGCVIELGCYVCKANQLYNAQLGLFLVVVLTTIITLFGFVITYAIEAGQGKALY